MLLTLRAVPRSSALRAVKDGACAGERANRRFGREGALRLTPRSRQGACAAVEELLRRNGNGHQRSGALGERSSARRSSTTPGSAAWAAARLSSPLGRLRQAPAAAKLGSGRRGVGHECPALSGGLEARGAEMLLVRVV